METIGRIADAINGVIWDWPSAVPILVLLLLGVGVFVTFRLKWIQLRQLGHAFRVIRGDYDDPNDAGDINHFQALSAALSATIGIGNIAGVATAIHYGGPGALFWMWLTALFGMASKYVECTLSLHYRRINPDGSASGGPMYYIQEGLGKRWKPLAILFAFCAVVSSFGSGNGVQAFSLADSFRADFGVAPWITGLVSATLVALVILGGIRRIGAFASRIVPFMGALYVTAGLFVLVLNYDQIPSAIVTIVSEAFTPRGGIGGFAGSTFSLTLIWGSSGGCSRTKRARAGAPIAHAAARTKEPVREGLVAMTGPLIDTLVICTITGLTIVTTGAWSDRHPDEVTLGGGSGVTIEAEALPPAETWWPVRDGRLVPPEDRGEVAFVRNHASVLDARLYRDEMPFSGELRFDDGGAPEAARLSGSDALLDPGGLVLRGEMALNGSPLTARAFQRGLAPVFPWGNFIVTIGVALFALSTSIAWSYYGDRSIEYLIGPRAVLPYRIVFVIVHFFGAIFSLEVVWAYADAALGLMAVPNLIAMVLLSGTVVRLTKDYLTRHHEPIGRRKA